MQSYMDYARRRESGGDDNAKNPLSSATGRYQFIDSTWADVSQRHPELGLTPEGRRDPEQQERAMKAFTADNGAGLAKAGIPQDNTSLYVAHRFGLGGAMRAYSADPNAMVSDVFPEVMKANPDLHNKRIADITGGAASRPAINAMAQPSRNLGAAVASYDTEDAPALSARNTMGPGVLVPGIGRGPTASQDQPYDWRSRLTQAAAAFVSSSDPEQSKALLAGNAQTAKDTGSFSLGPIDPQTGIGLRIHNKTGQVTTFKAQEPKEDADKLAYKASEAKRFSDLNGSIAADADKARAALGNIDTLRTALADPNVYQGSNGETVAKMKNFANSHLGMNLDGVDNTQVAQALMNKMVQESRTLNGGMPGSLSDKDLDFLKNANVSLNKGPEANQRILDIYAKLYKTAVERNDERIAYTKGGKMLDDNFNTTVAEKWRVRKATEDAADAAAAKAAPATTNTTTATKPVQKTKSGVSWSIN